MIICLCRAVSDREIAHAIQTHTLEKFLLVRRPGGDCGLCIESLKSQICKVVKCGDCRRTVEHLIKNV